MKLNNIIIYKNIITNYTTSVKVQNKLLKNLADLNLCGDFVDKLIEIREEIDGVLDFEGIKKKSDRQDKTKEYVDLLTECLELPINKLQGLSSKPVELIVLDKYLCTEEKIQ
jgi:hypothetical protein